MFRGPHADDWVTTQQIATAVGSSTKSIRSNWPRRYNIKPVKGRWRWPDVERVLVHRKAYGIGNGATMRDMPACISDEPFGPQLAKNWRPVVGYEGRYEVSDCGKVRSLLTGKVLAPIPAHAGHLKVSLHPPTNGRLSWFIHRLVLEAFIGTCPEGMMCRHLNGDPTDNRLQNLMWGTSSENMADMIRHGTHHQLIKTHCPQGHEYTEENTYRYKGRRYCRACQRLHSLAFKERHAA